MRVVVALGGNALQRRGEAPDPKLRQLHLRSAARAVAELARVHDVVVTHGNGPYVGMLALSAEQNPATAEKLDVLVAESEGAIGYLLESELAVELPGREIATLLTQTEIDSADPAFRTPTKPIGPVYSESEASRLSAAKSWTIVRDGADYRRAVPSPEPLRIREIGAIRTLLTAGILVVCAGGGGIPVAISADGSICGVEAVIDKDLSAALLAEAIGADTLLLLTDVRAVSTNWGAPGARLIAKASPKHLRRLIFAPGSMGPKIEGACRFVERTGGFAAIGAIEDAAAILEQKAGTAIHRDFADISYRF